jgi:hypothetical protein
MIRVASRCGIGALLLGAALCLTACDAGDPAKVASNSAVETLSPKKDASPKNPLQMVVGQACSISACPAGSSVVTASKKEGPFFACETSELSDYTNFVLGLVAMGKAIGAPPANLDPQTGEPAYQGTTKDMLDDLRGKASVESFDEAGSHCAFGKFKRRLKVLNYVQGRSSLWVIDEKERKSYWVPTSSVDLAEIHGAAG